MQDPQIDFKPLDPGRVNTMHPLEMSYWCGEFKCTQDELEEAVAQVGEHVAAVRQFLKSRA
jgi:hypothetical protein